MPESVDAEQMNNVNRIVSEAKPLMNDQAVKEIVDQNNEKLIGNGAECIVINKKGNPDLVVAFDYAGIKNIEEQKVQFYWHRIYSVLFPHNFPRFYSVWATEKSSGTIRQKIDSTDKPAQVNYPFGMVRDLCREFNLPLWVDRVSSNFTVGRDGGEYYLD